MKYTLLYILVILPLFLIPLIGQDAIIQVEGSIILGDNESAQPAIGTIRYSGTDFEGWNGTAWLSFTEQQESSNLLYQDEIYPIVKIGNQIWMAQSLKAIRFNDQTELQYIQEDQDWATTDTIGYSRYNNEGQNDNPFGLLYNYAVVSIDNPQNICPVAWHVPTNADWEELITYSGTLTSAGNRLKQAGDRHWSETMESVDNSTLFTALPAGLRGADGSFSNLKTLGVYWTSETNGNSTDGRAYGILHNDASIVPLGLDPSTGASVRCIKDE